MSSTNKTTHYELPQYVESDVFNPLVDDNDAYSKIDTALYNIADAEAGNTASITSLTSRMTTAEGDIDDLEAQNGDTVLTTTAQTLSGAVNELDSAVNSLDGRLDVVENDINNDTTGLKVKVTALETQNGSETLDTTSQTLSGGINEVYTMVKSGFVTPEMFGAVGDGVTDDSQPWQDALNTGTVVVATGTYKIHNVSVSNGNVFIVGNNAKIYPVMNSNNLEDNCFLFEDCDNAYVEGIEFTNPNSVEVENRSIYRNSAIKFDNCKYASLKNCYFHDNSKGIVGIDTNVLLRDGVAYTMRDCEYVVFDGCIFKGTFADEAGFIVYYDKEMVDIHVNIKDCKVLNYTDLSVFNIFADTINIDRLYSDDDCDDDSSLANFMCNYFNANNCMLLGYFRIKFDFAEANWYKAKSVAINNCKFICNKDASFPHRSIASLSEFTSITNCYFKNQSVWGVNTLCTNTDYQNAFRDYYNVLTSDDILVIKNCDFLNNVDDTNVQSAITWIQGEGKYIEVENCNFDLGNILRYGTVDARNIGVIFNRNTVKNMTGSGIGEASAFLVSSICDTASMKDIIVEDNTADTYTGDLVYLRGVYKNVTLKHNGDKRPFALVPNTYAMFGIVEVPYYTDIIQFNAVYYKGTREHDVYYTKAPHGVVHAGDIMSNKTHLYLVSADGGLTSKNITDGLTINMYENAQLSGVCYKALDSGTLATPTEPSTPTVGEVYDIGGVNFLCVALSTATFVQF